MPTELAAELSQRDGARPAGLAGGARGERLRAASATRSSATSSSATATSPASRPASTPTTSCSTTSSPGSPPPSCGRCSRGCATRSCRSSPPPATRDRPRNDGVFAGPFEVDAQRARGDAARSRRVGFDADAWRLDPVAAPVRQALVAHRRPADHALRPDDFGDGALLRACTSSATASTRPRSDPALYRTPLGEPVSLGVHESQSRLWENIVGRSRPFCALAAAAAAEPLPGGLDGVDADALYRAVNSVQLSLIRIEADETTYNLHIVLRFELELALIEGSLAVDDLRRPGTRACSACSALEVPSAAQGILQDVHWGAGLIGYFPTYTLGNLMAAQLWDAPARRPAGARRAARERRVRPAARVAARAHPPPRPHFEPRELLIA